MSDTVRGRWTYGDIIQDRVELTIGSFCSIGRGVRAIGLLGHKKDWITQYPFKTAWNMNYLPDAITDSDLKVAVKNDVWIGAYATLFGGTVLNDGVIVGAGSVVKKEVPPYSIVLGNPAVVIRKRYDDDTIARLLEIKWWDWPDEKIKQYIPLLCSDKIKEFIEEV